MQISRAVNCLDRLCCNTNYFGIDRMPYYLYKISTPDGIDLIKNLELLGEFQAFKEAKIRAKVLRAENSQDAASVYKVMFADNQLTAEEQLLEKRRKPVLMEHER